MKGRGAGLADLPGAVSARSPARQPPSGRLAPGLAVALERLRLRGHRRVLWQRHLWASTAHAPAQGLAIPHEEIDILCLDLDNRDDEAAFHATDPAAAALSRRIAELESGPPPVEEDPLAELADLFGLSQAETDLLLLCVAAELDPRMRRLYGYLHDDAGCCAPTPWLGATLFDRAPEDAVGPGSALVQWLLAYPLLAEEQPWSGMARWAADPRILGHLLGRPDPEPSFRSLSQWLDPSIEPAYVPAAAEQLARLLDGASGGAPRPLLALLLGAEGVGRKTWAARLAAERGLPLLCLDAPRLLGAADKSRPEGGDPSGRAHLVRAEREALLQGCALYWARADRVPESIWEEAPFAIQVQFFGVEQPIRLPARAPHGDLIAFSLPTPSQARVLWRRMQAPEEEDQALNALAERFTLTPAEILKLAPLARQGRQALWEACRGLSRGRLGRLATLLPCPWDWDDIVLRSAIKGQLREIADQAANRTKVYDEWGFGRLRPMGRGTSALFAGPSGTGKTMAAQVLAAEMGVNLLRIDLASVVSKYIGETEKNLRQVFDEAERLNAVLFFDEADALFGKRTRVKDAHDRYANIEINYLLQRMEAYEGLAILATNRKTDLDHAFLRRLRFILDFPMPAAAERASIWRLMFPRADAYPTATLEGVDWDQFGERLAITGASIKDIALHAAFLACAQETGIQKAHLLQAVRRELSKQGQFMAQEDLERCVAPLSERKRPGGN